MSIVHRENNNIQNLENFFVSKSIDYHDNNNIKCIRLFHYEDKKILRSVSTFDEDANLVDYTKYNKKGVKESLYEYDDKGNIRTLTKFYIGSSIRKTHTTYTENGTKESEISYDKNGVRETFTKYYTTYPYTNKKELEIIYHSNGNRKVETNFHYEGIDHRSSYDENGSLQESVSYDNTGKVCYRSYDFVNGTPRKIDDTYDKESDSNKKDSTTSKKSDNESDDDNQYNYSSDKYDKEST